MGWGFIGSSNNLELSAGLWDLDGDPKFLGVGELGQFLFEVDKVSVVDFLFHSSGLSISWNAEEFGLLWSEFSWLALTALLAQIHLLEREADSA
jgi:hypothetical protein